MLWDRPRRLAGRWEGAVLAEIKFAKPHLDAAESPKYTVERRNSFSFPFIFFSELRLFKGLQSNCATPPPAKLLKNRTFNGRAGSTAWVRQETAAARLPFSAKRTQGGPEGRMGCGKQDWFVTGSR